MTPPPTWTVIVPVKGGPTAKSRLARQLAAHDPSTRPLVAQLAAAMSEDTLDAVQACSSVGAVIVCSADPDTVRRAVQRGLSVHPDLGEGLNDVIRAAARTLLPNQRTAVLLGDLPSLRPHDLWLALEGAQSAFDAGFTLAVVPDADDAGTVLLAARGPGDLTPSFGAGSLAAHRGLGAQLLDLDLPGLRRDVDTVDDLCQALAVGSGVHTGHVMAQLPPELLSLATCADVR